MTYKFHKDRTLPQNGEVFVFGSNLAGIHGAGAAKIAYEKFGAEYGNGNPGFQGNSFAIPTKDIRIRSLNFNTVKSNIDIALKIMKLMPEHQFWFTAVGCGLAGNKIEDIAPLFENCSSNISLPDCFEPYLKLQENKIDL